MDTKPQGYQPTAEDLKGLQHLTFSTDDGLVIECYLEVEAGEAVTYDNPGEAAGTKLIWALVGGFSIGGELRADRVLGIEEAAVGAAEQAAQDALADVAASRYEDRMAG